MFAPHTTIFLTNIFIKMQYIGNNRFACSGKLIFGPKPHAVFLTLALINIPSIVFSILTAEVSIAERCEILSSFTGIKAGSGLHRCVCSGGYNA
jgi:hypothetical protein